MDLGANAASLGADVLRAGTVAEFRAALALAKSADRVTVVCVETDPLAPVPSSQSLVGRAGAEVSALASTQRARAAYHGGQARPEALPVRKS